MARHPLPSDLHDYSIAAYTRADNISAALRPTYHALAKPMRARMARSSSLNCILPRSKVLSFFNADHWVVAMPLEIYGPTFARVVANRDHFRRVVLHETISRTIAEDYQKPQDHCRIETGYADSAAIRANKFSRRKRPQVERFRRAAERPVSKNAARPIEDC